MRLRNNNLNGEIQGPLVHVRGWHGGSSGNQGKGSHGGEGGSGASFVTENVRKGMPIQAGHGGRGGSSSQCGGHGGSVTAWTIGDKARIRAGNGGNGAPVGKTGIGKGGDGGNGGSVMAFCVGAGAIVEAGMAGLAGSGGKAGKPGVPGKPGNVVAGAVMSKAVVKGQGDILILYAFQGSKIKGSPKSRTIILNCDEGVTIYCGSKKSVVKKAWDASPRAVSLALMEFSRAMAIKPEDVRRRLIEALSEKRKQRQR